MTLLFTARVRCSNLTHQLRNLPAAAHRRPPVHSRYSCRHHRAPETQLTADNSSVDRPQGRGLPDAQRARDPSQRSISASASTCVVVTIVRETSLGDEPYWLGRGVSRPPGSNSNSPNATLTRGKNFRRRNWPGHSKLTGRGEHISSCSNPSSQQHRQSHRPLSRTFAAGLLRGRAYVDQADKLATRARPSWTVSCSSTADDSTEDARLVSLFNRTDYPANDRVEQVVLTWSGRPRARTIQWHLHQHRAALFAINSSRLARLDSKYAGRAPPRLHSLRPLNQRPLINRHTVALRSGGHDLFRR
jgi:hypothetical protein